MKKEIVEEIAVDHLGLDLGEVRREIRKEYNRDFEQYFFDKIWSQLTDIDERAVILAEFLDEDFATALDYVEQEDYLVLTDDEVDDYKMDGRGHSLASYDGEEYYHTFNYCDYIYRIY